MRYIVINCMLAALLLGGALLRGENSLWLDAVLLMGNSYMVSRLNDLEKLIKSQGKAL
ncbi:hypothetical protein RA241_003689 [Cronobacter sakazakii]|nr:hypothetical protein [Cronobacter sakazakii]